MKCAILAKNSRPGIDMEKIEIHWFEMLSFILINKTMFFFQIVNISMYLLFHYTNFKEYRHAENCSYVLHNTNIECNCHAIFAL